MYMDGYIDVSNSENLTQNALNTDFYIPLKLNQTSAHNFYLR